MRHGVALVILSLYMSVSTSAHGRDVIYGSDDRVEISDVADRKVLIAARATASMMLTKNLTRRNGVYTAHAKTMQDQLHLCPGEQFGEQPSASDCTSVLIGPQTLLTAGHCVTKRSCPSSAFVFGYEVNSSGQATLDFPEQDVYFCKAILDRSNTESLDYAVIELDRPVSGRAPVKVAASSADVGESVYLLSYPGGIPLKYTPPVSISSSRKNTFTAELDDQGGSSGGPVFSAETHELLGILVSGPDDYVVDKKKMCRRIKRCRSGACEGEDSTHATVALEGLSPIQ